MDHERVEHDGPPAREKRERCVLEQLAAARPGSPESGWTAISGVRVAPELVGRGRADIRDDGVPDCQKCAPDDCEQTSPWTSGARATLRGALHIPATTTAVSTSRSRR